MKSLIRLAKKNDVQTLIAFNSAMALETENLILNEVILSEGVKMIFEKPEYGFYLIAEINNEIAGSLMVTYEWSDWRNSEIWWLQSVYVLPQYRRQGVFSSLYLEVEGMAAIKGVKIIRLYMEKENIKAHETYSSHGFKAGHYLLLEKEI